MAGRSPSGSGYSPKGGAAKASPAKPSIPNAAYLEVIADVRYWEDALVNGEADEDGTLIPFRERDTWHPWIDLYAGKVADWPRGMEADIHYKVCDAGEYYLTDAEGRRLAKWRGHYVPSEFLCHGDNGYGDYIILKVDEYGAIRDWRQPEIDDQRWAAIATEARRAETLKDGSVHEGAGLKGIAQNQSGTSDA